MTCLGDYCLWRQVKLWIILTLVSDNCISSLGFSAEHLSVGGESMLSQLHDHDDDTPRQSWSHNFPHCSWSRLWSPCLAMNTVSIIIVTSFLSIVLRDRKLGHQHPSHQISLDLSVAMWADSTLSKLRHRWWSKYFAYHRSLEIVEIFVAVRDGGDNSIYLSDSEGVCVIGGIIIL